MVARTRQFVHAGRVHPYSSGPSAGGPAHQHHLWTPDCALSGVHPPRQDRERVATSQRMQKFQKENAVKRFLVLFSLVGLLGSLAWAGSAREDSVERLQNSANMLHAIIDAPDKDIPEEVIDSAKCDVVVPHLIKGGFIVGAKHGRGVASCRTSAGWSAPAFISVGGGSWGLQIGAEGVDLVMLVMNDKGLQHLLSSKFQLSGEGSAGAGPVGRHASAGTDWKLNTEMLTYSRSRGIFAGLTLEGAVVGRDADSTVAIYGSDIPFKKILLGEVAAPAPATPFLRAVAEISHQARKQEAREQAPQAQEDRKPPEEQKPEDQKKDEQK